MQIIHRWDELEQPPQKTVLTIGNFDGVHLGHQTVFQRVVSTARSLNGTAAVYTFCPHPLKVLAPEKAPHLISTQSEKERLIAACGMDLMLCPPFTREAANQTAEDFVVDILVNRLGIVHLVVGADYAFGRGRQGNVDFLTTMGQKHGFTVDPVSPVTDDQAVCSSTRVRQFIQRGEVAPCRAILGRNFSLEGTVVHGDKRGRRLGFPTANLKTAQDLLPASGVYAVHAFIEGKKCYDAVANVGRKPTYGGQAAGIEVHLLDWHDDLYHQAVRIEFVQRLRDEQYFPSCGDLSAAIAQDVEHARDCLNRYRRQHSTDAQNKGLDHD